MQKYRNLPKVSYINFRGVYWSNMRVKSEAKILLQAKSPQDPYHSSHLAEQKKMSKEL